jgi:hypothetical protein
MGIGRGGIAVTQAIVGQFGRQRRDLWLDGGSNLAQERPVSVALREHGC